MMDKYKLVGTLLLGGSLLVAACTAPVAAPPATATPVESANAAPVTEAGADTLPPVDPLSVTGDIITAGSSTVYPLSEALAARFVDEGYAGNITIDSIGTGAGFERFCAAAETDIANASRPINQVERADCMANSRQPIEFRVGTDALAVVVNPGNDWVNDLTIEQLAQLMSDEVTTWAEVDPSWPAEPILRFSPGTDSGTFDYFLEAVTEQVYGDEGEAKFLNASNLQLSEDDNVLVQGIQGDLNTIGFFGYAYYGENAANLKIVSINGIDPSAENVDNGSYPLARPIFIYSDAGIITQKPQVGAFINFYLTYVNEEIRSVGYFPAPAAELDAAKAALAAVLAGEVED
jgi:phosphate transport system substrate-binding protein